MTLVCGFKATEMRNFRVFSVDQFNCRVTMCRSQSSKTRYSSTTLVKKARPYLSIKVVASTLQKQTSCFRYSRWISHRMRQLLRLFMKKLRKKSSTRTTISLISHSFSVKTPLTSILQRWRISMVKFISNQRVILWRSSRCSWKPFSTKMDGIWQTYLRTMASSQR